MEVLRDQACGDALREDMLANWEEIRPGLGNRSARQKAARDKRKAEAVDNK